MALVAIPEPRRTAVAPPRAPVSVELLYREHADFVWATLHRLGAREADLPDLLQEVFIVVHRRLDTFDGTSKPTTWLFGICLRVAAAQRRRAYVRREAGDDDLGSLPDHAGSPEDALTAADERARLGALLTSMDPDRCRVLVMFELEELSCAEIAAQLEIPIGTVHSRLHAARKELAEKAARRRAIEGRPR